MTFLQPYILWGLPLLLVPILIHLINRLRHRPQPWAAMQFLLNAAQRSVSQDKLRHFLILLFRVLAVAALVLFVARPLVGGWLGWALSSAPDAVVLVLDRSASMEVKPAGSTATRRDQALSLWSEALKPFERASRLVLLDSGTRTPHELANWRDLQSFSSARPTDTATDLPDLLQRALNYIVDNKPGVSEIWIASDLQKSNWSVNDESRWQQLMAQFGALPQRVRFRLLTWPAQPTDNTSISLAEFSRRTRNNQPELAVALDLQRSAQSSSTVKLISTVNGSRAETDLTLSGQSFRSRQILPLPAKSESGWGSFEIPNDANPRDNKVYFVFGAELPLHASVISADSGAARVFQLAGADLSGEQMSRAKIVSPNDLATDNWSTNALVVWQATLPTGTAADRVTQFVHEGGIVIFFPTDNAGTNNFQGLGWGEVSQAKGNFRFSINQWNEIDGPLARTEEGLSLPIRQAEFLRRVAISGAKNILASFSDGAPFLVRQAIGKGEIFFCASLPKPDWSNLGEGPVLVPMLQRLLQAGGKRLQSANFAECGRTSNPDEARLWVSVAGGKDARYESGVYKTSTGLIAINRPPEEDDPERLALADAKRLFGAISVQTFQEKENSRDRLQGEVWRIVLMLMLLFLLLEGILILPPKTREKTGIASQKAVQDRENMPLAA
jgi:hypothetical protein